MLTMLLFVQQDYDFCDLVPIHYSSSVYRCVI